MPDAISTDSLMKRLFRTKNLSSFLQQHEKQLETADFCTQLRMLCDERGLVPERVILSAQIDRTYGHQLFNGTRKPSRDKVIQLAFGMGLNIDETQKLLRAAGKSPLYPRLKRDAVILFSLKNGFNAMRTQELLSTYGLTLLGELI